MVTSHSINYLRLKPNLGISLDEETIDKVVALFPKFLDSERQAFNHAFAVADWREVWFLAEKLLGAVLYFDLLPLQAILDVAIRKAADQTLTRELLDKLNQEIDAVLLRCQNDNYQ